MGRSTARDDYHRHGFTTLAGLLDPAVIRGAFGHLAMSRAEQRLGPDTAIVAVATGTPFAAELAGNPRLTVVASALLDAPAAAFGFTYLCKPARIGLPALWHQDGSPWADRLAGARALTMWIALDDADATNGCLRVIPGSHRLDVAPLRPNTVAPSLFGVEMDPALVDETLAVDVALRAGDVSVHHPHVIHGSGPNPSGRPRRAIAIRYRAVP
jgi:phytanoyl-CoA hydroxylase